ncbi:alpha/beta hydrolase [Candidatus Nanohalovita haloferacivicina]|uniref:alpha/beta hydrolase n=1 Tax=Candidatus Nanohalovita haloferacivicina TaxID=2978046 RepID=UPI00325FCCFE|nr:Phospholipase/carboxylesterase [Candidatus Nanohalobia archaeon BNXNv]
MSQRIHEDQPVQSAGLNLEEAERAVIMLHGRGASAGGMIRMSEKLPEAAYLAPQASKRTWYPRSFLEPREKNQPHLDSALNTVDHLVEKASEEVGTENVVLLGFSQGACLASEYAASNPEKYGGIILFSGGLIGEEVGEFSGDMESTRVFIGCADNDPHIPLERVEKTEEIFNSLNADVEKYIMQGSHHGIVDHEIEKASEIIK